ncbi:Unknown protein sequence [Pseudomonas savastanoi pv. phaseolicola]|nr:Unknown protein sequence [Pseudomonas savastanoi pv. phaseolicola]
MCAWGVCWNPPVWGGLPPPPMASRRCQAMASPSRSKSVAR